jgi:hypothetical protein
VDQSHARQHPADPAQVRFEFQCQAEGGVNMGTIKSSSAKGKKWSVQVGGKTYHAGDSNAKVSPGTPRGDAYCARSAKIKGSGVPNKLARKMWGCVGSKSVASKAKKIGSKF